MLFSVSLLTWLLLSSSFYFCVDLNKRHHLMTCEKTRRVMYTTGLSAGSPGDIFITWMMETNPGDVIVIKESWSTFRLRYIPPSISYNEGRNASRAWTGIKTSHVWKERFDQCLFPSTGYDWKQIINMNTLFMSACASPRGSKVEYTGLEFHRLNLNSRSPSKRRKVCVQTTQ